MIFLGLQKTVCFESKNELLDELTFSIIILDIRKKILLLIISNDSINKGALGNYNARFFRLQNSFF